MNSTKPDEKTVSGQRVRNVAIAVASPAIAVTAMVAPAMLGASAAHAAPTGRVQHFHDSGATIQGSKWLKGRGVPVYRGRQCTELASRLYAKKHWGSLMNIYGMRSGRTYSKTLQFHSNGSGYTPVPGDVLVELGGSYQHVAVVNKVTKHNILTVEQNATASARHVYPVKGKQVLGAYGPRHVGGFIHSSKNKNTN